MTVAATPVFNVTNAGKASNMEANQRRNSDELRIFPRCLHHPRDTHWCSLLFPSFAVAALQNFIVAMARVAKSPAGELVVLCSQGQSRGQAFTAYPADISVGSIYHFAIEFSAKDSRL